MIMHPEWCISAVLWGVIFAAVYVSERNPLALDFNLCCQDQGKWASAALVFILYIIYMIQHVKLGTNTAACLMPDRSLWCWWEKALKPAFALIEVFPGPAISASRNHMKDLTHSRKHMRRKENSVAEMKVLLFLRPKWLLYVTMIDSFSNIFTTLSYKLCFLPILLAWAGVITFDGETRGKIQKIFV